MSEKSFKVLKIVLLSLGVVVLSAFMIFIIIYKHLNFSFNIKSEDYKLVFDERYNVSEVTQIKVDVLDADVYVKYSESDDIRLQVFDKDLNKFNVNFENGVLSLDYDIKSSLCIGICFFDRRVIVYLPEEFEGILNIDSASGDVDVARLLLANIDIETASGDVIVNGALSANIKTASGNVHASIVKDTEIKTISGDIDVNEIKDLVINTTSGEVDVYNLDGSLDISSVSGDIDLKNINLVSNSKIHTVSGEVDIARINSIYIETKTISGDVEVYNSDRFSEIQLNIKTTSGDIEVN